LRRPCCKRRPADGASRRPVSTEKVDGANVRQ
jgi:hypothetical protein